MARREPFEARPADEPETAAAKRRLSATDDPGRNEESDFLQQVGVEKRAEDLATASPAQQAAAQSKAEELLNSIRSFDWGILWFFPLYFIGGFFFYGSLYGALAASVEDESEVQSYTFIILFPLILPLILFGAILKNPNGPLAFWLSEIPLTSPLVMMMRLASTDVPVWEVLLSIGLLFGGVLGVAWMAAKIYRMAILMYGKKLSLKEMARLVRT